MPLRLRESLSILAIISLGNFANAASLTMTEAWFRALPSGLPAGGYFTLHNNGARPVNLTGAESPACGMLMLHKSESSAGMSRMTSVAAIAVPAGGTLAFAPGGYHLMCMSPSPTMKPGNHVPVTLEFSSGEKIAVSFAVRNAAGK